MSLYGKKRVLTLNISYLALEKLVDKIFTCSKKILLIAPIATYTCMRAFSDKKLTKILNSFDFLVPDSYWLLQSYNLLHETTHKKRLYGPSIMIEVIKQANIKHRAICMIGTTKQTLKSLTFQLHKQYPNVPLFSIPLSFNPINKKEIKTVADYVNQTNANIIFIALGSPLQECFAYSLKNLIKKPVSIITVGAAFDFISKIKKQAPLWMQNHGLEWLFRLINEPQRLWQRYLIYGFAFLLLITKQKIGHKNYE